MIRSGMGSPDGAVEGFRLRIIVGCLTLLLASSSLCFGVVVPKNLELVSRFSGGAFGGLALIGDLCYVGQGSQIHRIDVSSATSPELVDPSLKAYYTANGLATDGTYLYVATSNEDQLEGCLWTLDPASGERVNVNNTDRPLWRVAVLGDYLFSVGAAPNPIADAAGLRFSHPVSHGITPGFHLPKLTGAPSGGWGEIVAADDFLYIAVESHGLFIVDASDRLRPTIAKSIPMMGGANDLDIEETVLYVATPHGIRIFDVTDPRDPNELLPCGEGLDVLVVDVEGSALLAGHRWGLAKFDVTNPASVQPGPVYVPETEWRPRELAVRNGTAFLLEELLGFLVFDVTAASSTPPPIGRLYLSRYTSGVSMQLDRMAAVIPSVGASLIDTLNPRKPRHLGWAHHLNSYSALHYEGDRVYGGTIFPGEFHIIDVSDPLHPKTLGMLPPIDWMLISVSLRDDVVYLGGLDGMYLIDVSDPRNPWLHKQIPALTSVTAHVASGTYEYLGTSSAVFVYDGSDRLNPEHISTVPSGPTNFLHLSGGFLYHSYAALKIYDLARPGNPVLHGSLSFPEGQTGAIASRGNLLLMSGQPQKLYYIDVSNPADPRIAAEFPVSGFLMAIHLRGPYVITASEMGVDIWREIYEPIPGENLPPVAAVVANDLTGAVGEMVTFDGSASFDPEGGPVSYSWRPLPETPNYEAVTGYNETFFATVPLQPGVYRFDLGVNDGELNSDPLEVRYYVPGLHGYVTHEGTNYPVEGAEVCAFGFENPGTETSFCTLTDETGRYVLATPIGGATISAVADGLEPYEARVDVPSSALLWNISLVGGTVPFAGKAVAAGDGTPLEGVTVLLDPGRVPSTLTGGNGEFTFDHVLEGERLISLAQDGFGADAVSVDVSGGVGATVEFALTQGQPASIVGSVTDVSTGLPVGGASVSLGGVRNAETRANGSFAFDQIVSGTYAVMLTLPDGTLDVRTANIAPGENHIPLSIGAQQFVIAVNVLDSAGQPLSGADLILTTPTQNRCKPLGTYVLSGRTDSTGYARLRGLPPGIHRISVFSETSEPFDEELTVLSDGELQTLVARFAWGDLTRDSCLNWEDLFILSQRWSGSFDPYPDPTMPSAEKPELGTADLIRLLRALRGDE